LKKLLPLFFLLFGFWFCIRWVSISLASDAFQTDPDNYRHLAIELSANGLYGANSLPTAFRPPLYPWILSFGVSATHDLSITFVKILHSILCASTCLLVFYATTIAQNLLWPSCFKTMIDHWDSPSDRRFWNRFQQVAAPVVAATLVALDPILVRQSQLIMTETLATFLAVLTLWLMCRAYQEPTPLKLLTVGLGIGLSVLCRPTAIVWGGLFIVTLLLGHLLVKSPNKLPFRRIAWCLLTFVFGLSSCVIPWGLRNQMELNRWIFTTTHGGYTLLLANNNSLYDHFEKTASRNWDDTTFQAGWSSKIAGLNELEQDQLANAMARETIQQRPLLFFKSCLIRLGWLWVPWPNQSNWIVSAGIGVWYTFVYGAAFFGVAISWRYHGGFFSNPLLMPTCCLILSLSMVHAVYWSNNRMRSVAMPALYTLASIPISFALNSSKKHRLPIENAPGII
jgi:hypothetical protein